MGRGERQLGTSCLVRLLLSAGLSLGVPLLIIGWVAVVLAASAALAAGGLEKAAGALAIAGIPSGIALVLALVVGLAWSWRVRVVGRMDQGFEALGLTAAPFMAAGRQYRGTCDGRFAEAYLMRGPVFELFIEGRVGSRILLLADNALARRVRGAGLDLPRSLDGMLAYADEPSWALEVLRDPAAAPALQRLLGADTGGMTNLFFRPDGVLQRVRGAGAWSLEQDAVRTRAEDIRTLLEIAERHPPERVVDPTPAEARRDARWGLPTGALVGTLILMLVPALGVFVGAGILGAAVYLGS